MLHLRRCMGAIVDHLSAGLKLEIDSSLAQRSSTRQLRRSSKSRAVMLKVSPWKGVIYFGKRGKLNPRYIGPFKIIAKVGIVAYRLELPEQLSRVHSRFHVLNLKKCMADEPLAIQLDEIQIDDKLHFIEEPVEIMDREVKRLKQSRILIFKVLDKVGAVAHKLELPQELSRVHSTFHVSNLKKCYSDKLLTVPLEGLHIDDKLRFMEEPVEIMDREAKWLNQNRIPIVKVRWNSRRGPEFTWEREDQFQKKYPHLFTKPVPSSSVAT
ncbi:hypothetical protein Tco_1039140 [Tanacetum coccineum]